MNTTIYDAYRMNIRTMKDVHSFTQKLKEYQSKAVMQYLIGSMANRTARLVDTCYLNRHSIQNIQPTENMTNIMENHPKINMNRALFNNALAWTIDTIEDRKKQWFEEQRLCVFPQDENHICAMIFGKPLAHLFQIYSNGKANKEQAALFAGIHLEDYHYQNQTDRPENITEEEWETRRNEWNRMLASYTPARDGVLIMIITQDDYENMAYRINYRNLLAHPNLSKQQRAETIAYNAALKEYIHQHIDISETEPTMSSYLQCTAQFSKNIRNPKSEIAKRICQLTDTLIQHLPDITSELLSTPISKIL